MGPFSFLNTAFLAGLAAAALPILIHLFSRRRAREMPFSELRFLDEITRRKIRRMQLRQWILLALRTLAIALIALALSRPVWHGGGLARQRGASTVAILIDDSFSMEALLDASNLLPVGTEEGALNLPTRFEQARQRALQILELLEEGDRAMLVFTGTSPRVPYESTVRDPALLREELERAEPRAVRTDLVAALERVYPVLASARTPNREIFIISDFQSNEMEQILRTVSETVQAGAAPVEGDAPADPLVPIPANTRLYLLPIEAPEAPNAAVDWCFFERDPSGPGGRLTVRLQNPSPVEMEDQVLQVFSAREAELLGEGYASVPAGGSAQTTISVPVLPADGLLTVRSAPDLLETDNRYYLSAATTSRFHILIVTGGALTEPRIRSEATFPILALDPYGGEALLTGRPASLQAAGEGLRLFEATTVAESDLGLSGAIEADAVLLLNVGRLSAAAAELLEQYHAEGGNILMAMGDRVDPRTYNTQILARLTALRLENIVGDLEGDAHFSLRPAVTGHEIFEGFPLSPGEALSSARFRRALEVRLGPSSRVLAEFSGALPALVEEPGLLLFTSSLDGRWSDFPTSAAYLPFLHRALLHLILQGRIGRPEPRVGETLHYPLAAEWSGEDFRCQGPGGFAVALTRVQNERGALLRTAPVPEPGFYEILTGEAGGPPFQATAVNVDTAESDLTMLGARESALIFGDAAVRLTPGEELSRQVLQARYGRELWRLCLALALLMLVAESVIARGRLLA